VATLKSEQRRCSQKAPKLTLGSISLLAMVSSLDSSNVAPQHDPESITDST
jgi:hypothetical protein